MENNQRSSPSSGSADNNNNKDKVLSKFKIPENCSSAVYHEEDGAGAGAGGSNDQRRFCAECARWFDSPKGLAGHKRIHSEAFKHKQQQKLVKNQSTSASQRSMLPEGFPCELCTKTFPSVKSYFGHMKCHGPTNLRPPRGYSSNYPEDEVDMDWSEQMPKWTVKAKRGGKGVKTRRLGEIVGGYEDAEVVSGAESLFSMKNSANSSDSSRLGTLGDAAVLLQITNGVDHHHEDLNDAAFSTLNVGNGFHEPVGDYLAVTGKMGIEEGESSGHVMKDDIVAYVGQEGNAGAPHVAENNRVEDVLDGMNTELVLGGVGAGGRSRQQFDGMNDENNHWGKMVTGSSKNIKKAKKMKMMELNHEKQPAVGGSGQASGLIATDGKYNCSDCDKSFSSHQALGGHKSSHNKFKVTIINGNSSYSNHPIRKPSPVSTLSPLDQNLGRNEEIDQIHHLQQQLHRSHEQGSRVVTGECATKRNYNDEVGGSSKADHTSSTVYQCSVCNKIFATGQALGGHKRCHWTAPDADAQAEAPTQPQAQAQLAGEEASTQTGGRRIRLMGFDLNVRCASFHGG